MEKYGFERAELAALYQRLVKSVAVLPAVESASLSTYGLFTGFAWRNNAYPDGLHSGEDDHSVHVDVVAGDYFETLGIPLLAGRRFTTNDRAGAPNVAIVSQAFADRFFQGESPIGRLFGFGARENSRDFEIVGVVADAKYQEVRETANPMVYRPAAQQTEYLEALSVRVVGDPDAVASKLRTALAASFPGLPVSNLRSLSTQIDRSLARELMISRLSIVFGCIALGLAMVGLYAVLAYSVARRFKELGLRLALGAQNKDIVGLVMGDAFGLVAIGVAVGLPAAIGLSRFASSLLYGVTATDPLALAGATGILALAALAALAASYLPARRAARHRPDAVTALRMTFSGI